MSRTKRDRGGRRRIGKWRRLNPSRHGCHTSEEEARRGVAVMTEAAEGVARG